MPHAYKYVAPRPIPYACSMWHAEHEPRARGSSRAATFDFYGFIFFFFAYVFPDRFLSGVYCSLPPLPRGELMTRVSLDLHKMPPSQYAGLSELGLRLFFFNLNFLFSISKCPLPSLNLFIYIYFFFPLICLTNWGHQSSYQASVSLLWPLPVFHVVHFFRFICHCIPAEG